jgi:hypothetical protein
MKKQKGQTNLTGKPLTLLLGLLVTTTTFAQTSQTAGTGPKTTLTAAQMQELQAMQAAEAVQIQQLNAAMSNAVAQAAQTRASSTAQGAQMTKHTALAVESDDTQMTDDSVTTNTPDLFTNSPPTLLFDTTGSVSNTVLPSWRDVRTSPAPTGMALGILIATNCPFTVTQISAEVILDDPSSLANTDFEVGFFRNTNDFALGMYEDPEYAASEWAGTLSMTLTNLADGNWLLTVQLPTYGWGTNRLVTIRTVPLTDGAMTHLSLIGCGDAVPGVTAYASDNTTTNMVQVEVPKMQVWRSMIAPMQAPYFAPPPGETVGMDMDVIYLPGYQLGSSTNLNEPMDWETDLTREWSTTVDSSQGTQFFITRPDPTQ